MKPRFLAALGVGLGLVAGGATAVAVGTPGLAGAASPAASSSTDDGSATTTAPTASSTDDESTTTESTESADSATPADPDAPARPEPGEFLQDTLQPLIDDGTLTQEQADRVIAALQDARPFAGGHGPGFGGRGHGHVLFGLDTAATALGVTAEDLRTALAEGKSIADVATEQGVDLQTVIDALVAQASTHLDEAVADGKLTAEEAATRKAELTDKITELVNQAGGLRPGRPVPPDAPDTTTGD